MPSTTQTNRQQNDIRLTPAQAKSIEIEQAKLLERLNQHIQSRHLDVLFPANIAPLKKQQNNNDQSSSPPPPLRTKPEFVNLRLLESGILFTDTQTLGDLSVNLLRFVDDLKSTGCYNNVQAYLDQSPPTTDNDDETTTTTTNDLKNDETTFPCNVEIRLDEKKWYKLYVGGGMKPQKFENDFHFPKLQFESSLSLLNLRGVTDKSTVSYYLDQTSNPTVGATHEAPFYSMLGERGGHWVLTTFPSAGSKINFHVGGLLDTVDWEWYRSYKEFVRRGEVRVESGVCGGSPEASHEPYQSLSYHINHRDLLPRRHTTLPYACDASPDIVAQAGPNLLHSFKYSRFLNGYYTNDKYNPTKGYDYSFDAEVATPPGDVGFVKCSGKGSVHVPLLDYLAMHVSVGGGFLRGLGFGGLCRDGTYVSDRFFVGGPMQLRGFGYAGIGPRADKGGSSSPGGDSLGGEIYYTSSLSLSTPLNFIPQLRQRQQSSSVVPSLFGFVNAGTLSGWGVPFDAILRSSRLSIGGGVAMATPMGRLEATYAVPLRYGPKDVRRGFQFGFGFSFG